MRRERWDERVKKDKKKIENKNHLGMIIHLNTAQVWNPYTSFFFLVWSLYLTLIFFMKRERQRNHYKRNRRSHFMNKSMSTRPTSSPFFLSPFKRSFWNLNISGKVPLKIDIVKIFLNLFFFSFFVIFFKKYIHKILPRIHQHYDTRLKRVWNCWQRH